MEKCLRFKTRKCRRQFVFSRRCHQWVSGAIVVVMSETTSINIIFAYSQRLGFHYFTCPIARESHRGSSSSVSSRSGWGNLYLCFLWQWRYILNLQSLLSLACWLLFFLPMIRKLFSTFFKASTSYAYFHYVSYGIFAHWFSLNQMFKFSILFATGVEKNRPSHGCFNRGLRSKKDLKKATEHLYFSSNK